VEAFSSTTPLALDLLRETSHRRSRLVVTSIVLRDRTARTRHKIDYSGSVLLLIGVSALLLVTTSEAPHRLRVVVTADHRHDRDRIGFVAAFLVREHYATEPIVPLRLFRKRVFSVSNAAGFIVGVAMFGAIIYCPYTSRSSEVFRRQLPGSCCYDHGRAVHGLDRKRQIIARIGRYKVFPIVVLRS